MTTVHGGVQVKAIIEYWHGGVQVKTNIEYCLFVRLCATKVAISHLCDRCNAAVERLRGVIDSGLLKAIALILPQYVRSP